MAEAENTHKPYFADRIARPDSDLDLLGKHIHRQTIGLNLRGCSSLKYLNNPLQEVPSLSYVQLVSSREVQKSQTGSSAAKSN